MFFKHLQSMLIGQKAQEESNTIYGIHEQKPRGLMDLIELPSGESGRVVELHGGREFLGKLEAMGVVPGRVITKKSAILSKGPVILEKGSVQFAIGYEMARKIYIEPITKDENK